MTDTTRGQANWAKKVERLHVDAGVRAHGYTVEGRRVAGPQQGFGRLWERTSTVRLGEAVTPERLIADWRAAFGSFWPRGGRFYGALAGVAPGDVAPLQAGPVLTGVLVLYADETSFTFMTPEGHLFAALITFSAARDASGTVARIDFLLRTSDPLYARLALHQAERGPLLGGDPPEPRDGARRAAPPRAPDDALPRSQAAVAELAERAPERGDRHGAARRGGARPAIPGCAVSGALRIWPHLLGALLIVGLVVGVAAGPQVPVPALLSELILVLPPLVTGWVLAAKARGNLLGAALLSFSGWFVGAIDALALGGAVRGTAPGLAAWLFWISGDDEVSWIWVPAVWTLLIWIPLHFPDGRLPSRRWRWLSVLAVVELASALVVFGTSTPGTHGTANPVRIEALTDLQVPLLGLSAALAITCFVGTLVSLVARYRGGGVQVRAQLRWMLWAVAIATGTLASSWFVPDSATYNTWVPTVYALIPIAIAIAVLRYRLYEIDRIISRTAAYALVTVLVVGTYLGVVLLVSVVVPGVDPDSPITVALPTLAAAAVLLPALRRVRRGVDRVFDRARYDAERVIAAYGEQVRNGADPHTAGRQLLDAVEASLDPAAVGLWVRR